MKRKIYIIIALFLSVIGSIQSTDYVAISEILYDTPLNEDPTQLPHCFGEFIELYNAGNKPVDLTGWQLATQIPAQSYTLPAVTLAPQSFLVVAFGEPYAYNQWGGDEDVIAEGWTDFHAIFDLEPNTGTVLFQKQMMLPNNTCKVMLKDNTGKTRDYIQYDENSIWPSMKAKNNDCSDIDHFNYTTVNSIQRISIYFDLEGCTSFNESNWIGGVGEYDRDPSFGLNSCMHSDITLAVNIISQEPQIGNISNYIVTVRPTVEMSSIPTENNKMQLEDLEALINIDYFDGLGRPLQTVQKAFTPLKKNLVTYKEYDEYDRLEKEWLPIAVDFDNMEYEQFKAASQLFYTNESRAYKEHKYSTDVLSDEVICDELVGIQAPGADMNNHYVARKTFPNEANTIKWYRIDNNTLQNAGYYSEKTLLCEQSTDEDGKTITGYKNKQGRIVMQRSSTNVDTHYVYNDLGQLCYVLPALAADADGSVDAVNKYGYVYKYDDRGNCIYKKLPGCEPIYMVYDRANRLVLSQDGNQRTKPQWTVTKYDIFGRVVYTGTIEREIEDLEKGIIHDNVITESYIGGANTGFANTGYTCNYFSDDINLLTTNYYDNYDFLEIWPGNITNDLVYMEKDGYSMVYAASPIFGETQGCKGLLTATVTNIIGTENYVYNIDYYDYLGRVVQTRSTNHLGGYDIVYNELDFTGKPNKTLKEHNISGQSTVSELYEYEYDHAGRLTDTHYTINSNARILLSSNTYDELGRLTNKTRHDNVDTESFQYNIRNWTTKITSGTFQENLYYNTSLPSNANAYYNGNISANTWTYNGQVNGYIYYYDALNRLTGDYAIVNNQFMVDYQMSENFNYDKMGNIRYLSRWDNQDITDQLTLNYNGNQLTYVTDNGISQNLYNVKEYQNKSTATSNEFAYDANGNLTKDLDRDIVTIKYNLLNLPEFTQFKNGNVIKNLYDAGGQKLKSEYYTRLTAITPLGDGEVLNPVYNFTDYNYTGTAYLGNMEYKIAKMRTVGQTSSYYDDITLDHVYNTEGYILYFSRDENYYAYYRRDHLGNNREVWLAMDGGITIQRTQYYPSGLPWKSNTGDVPEEQNKKYNGKEFVEAHGYDMYDYGARGMYPAIGGRFMSIDPLAEKYYSISPYSYCAGNPISRIDIEGKFTLFINGQNFLSQNKKYWGDFDDKFLTRFNEKNPTYVDGSLGGWLNTLGTGILSNNLMVENRIEAGRDWGKENVASIIAGLHRTKNGVIDEKIRIVTHSMGGAFGKGVIFAIMEYLKANPQLCVGLSIDNYDFDPFQANSLWAIDNVYTFQARHEGMLTWENLLDNPLLANQKENNIDKNGNKFVDDKTSSAHDIMTFIHLINTLPEGKYRWNGTEWVRQ